MFDDDPLTHWLEYDLLGKDVPKERIALFEKNLHLKLKELVAYINSNPQNPDFSKVYFHSLFGPVGFSDTDLQQAQDAFLKIFEIGGKDANKVQESLLFLIGTSAKTESILFWVECVNLNKSRDMLRHHRQKMAIAALAYCAIKTKDSTVTRALHKLTHHHDPYVRAQAIYYLSRAYTEAELPIPETVIADMTLVIKEDSNFEPRFQARRILRLANVPSNLDNVDGVYDLKVVLLSQPRNYRIISIRAEQSLKDLQRFIQHAFDWNNDHLFSFYMNGRKYDDQYRYSCAYEEARPPWAYEVQLGELGLVKNHRFLYHFDYGDDHLFEIEVKEIRTNIRPGNYPRLIGSYGKSPNQYH